MKNYFVIKSNEDGISIESVSEQELLEGLHDNSYGESPSFTEKLPNKPIDLSEESKLIIIKGEIVVPKPKFVVKEYKL